MMAEKDLQITIGSILNIVEKGRGWYPKLVEVISSNQGGYQ